MKSIIITGANTGIGLECAVEIAKIAPRERLILACRNEPAGNEAIQHIRQKSGHKNLICLPLDLASMRSIWAFKTAFSSLPDPGIAALINNAGLLNIGKEAYTENGFELTFGTNHLGPFCLTLLLLPFMASHGSITFVTSATHDPAEKTEIQPPVYTSGKELAFPEESSENRKTLGQRRYSNSKLCNILTAYVLHEKLADKNIRVNAFDPGSVPGTGLAKDYPALFWFAWKNILPLLSYFRKNAHSPQTSGRRLANLAYGSELRHLNGIYYSNGRVTRSSADSYNKSYQAELWKSSIELTNIKPQDTIIPLA